MPTDNRLRPRIHRTDDKHDKALRAYAREHGIEPWQALETAIGRLQDPDGPEIDRLTEERDAARKVADDLRAEVDQLTRKLVAARAAPHNEAWRRLLSPELAARVDARIEARVGRDFAFVVKNGCDRIEASDKYVDAQKASKRAAKKGA